MGGAARLGVAPPEVGVGAAPEDLSSAPSPASQALSCLPFPPPLRDSLAGFVDTSSAPREAQARAGAGTQRWWPHRSPPRRQTLEVKLCFRLWGVVI